MVAGPKDDQPKQPDGSKPPEDGSSKSPGDDSKKPPEDGAGKPPGDDADHPRDEPGNHDKPDGHEEPGRSMILLPKDQLEVERYLLPGPIGYARNSAEATLNNVYNHVLSNMQMALKLPREVLEKKVFQDDVKIKDLPWVFQEVSIEVDKMLFALRRDPEVVPNEEDKHKMKEVFLTLKLVQSKLAEIAETNGYTKTGPRDPRAAQSPASFTESEENRDKRPSVADIGARLNGRHRRGRGLANSETVTLNKISEDVGVYAVIAAHLLGVKVTEFELIEDAKFDKHVEHNQDLRKLLATQPPQPWADVAGQLELKMPRREADRFGVGGGGR